MRAFYATHKHLRVFVFGVPEGWHVTVYDLQKRAWMKRAEVISDTLSEAKKRAAEEAAAVLESQAPELKWH